MDPNYPFFVDWSINPYHADPALDLHRRRDAIADTYSSMKALSVLYGGRLEPEAFEKLLDTTGDSSFSLALAAAGRFPGVEKTVLLCSEGEVPPNLKGVEALIRPSWTKKSLLEELSRLSSGYDFLYYAWADCPFLDHDLSAALAERHKRYRADYSYADGWPYGFAPELLTPGAAGILSKLAADEPVERDALFDVIQKDINAFDIETEISAVDLRHYRITLAADSRRNLLLISRLMEAGLRSAAEADTIIREKPELFRTLPAFFSIQVSSSCPQTCSYCPWPLFGGDVLGHKEYMSLKDFSLLLDKIQDFAGDAVIDLSLWGEMSLHPQKIELIQEVLSRRALSLIVETSGIGWNETELSHLAAAASGAGPKKNHMAPLSWIVSLDAHDPLRYKEIRGPGFSEARSCAKKLLTLFPKDTYVQAVRVKGFEDDIEHFYRSWKGEDLPAEFLSASRKEGSHIIIQKYDDFAGALPKMQASDLSPVKRRPCWHIQRDMDILLDGSVPCCREDMEALKGNGILGNAIRDGLDSIWEKGASIYLEHCASEYRGICAVCDEYYTYNF